MGTIGQLDDETAQAYVRLMELSGTELANPNRVTQALVGCLELPALTLKSVLRTLQETMGPVLFFSFAHMHPASPRMR